MSAQMAPPLWFRREIEITNESGLRARPAAEFMQVAKAFRAEIWIVKGEVRFSATSIIEVLMADLDCGERATIEAKGQDAAEAVKRLVALALEFGKRDREGTWNRFRRSEEDF